MAYQVLARKYRPQRFDDIALGTAMAKPGERVSLLVSRPGESDPFEVSDADTMLAYLRGVEADQAA